MAEALRQQRVAPVAGVGWARRNTMADAQGRMDPVPGRDIKLAHEFKAIDFQANFSHLLLLPFLSFPFSLKVRGTQGVISPIVRNNRLAFFS